ncbi:MAG: universal stress protein [Desulfovermiculus sp.]|nr:universal stress protein [Desulfovermiculus sp.]
MLKAILFPTDFSQRSHQVLDVFEDLRARGADKVVLLHVVDERSFQAMEHYAYGRAEEVEKHILDSASEELEKMSQKLQEQGFTVVPKVVVGFPVREILKAEKEDDVSMIVLGSHGGSNLQEIFLGSVAEKVVRKCTKSIMVVKR